MRSVKSPFVVLGVLAAVACTSTVSQPPAPSSTGGGSLSEAPAGESLATGTIVFNRLDADGIAVYRLDLETGTEDQIRPVDDFATLSPDGSRFFTAVPRPDDGRIGPVSFNVDGSGYAMLPAPDETLQMGAGWWSPDGSRFFVGGWDDTDPSRAGLYTIGSVDGDPLVRLTHPGNPPSDHPVAYSPDGSRVLFIREKPPYDHSGPMNVFTVKTNGSGLVRLNPPRTTSLLDGQSWSPDGRQVAIVASRDGHDGNAVFVVNVDGTHARRITPWSVTLRAEWSPDGEWIVFDKADAEEIPRDLFLVHPDGTGLTQITSHIDDNKMSFAPVWSADSQTLLFIRREYSADGTDLWTVNVDGTGLSQVTDLPAEYTGYRWLP
jgi:Tol biopolymer transport system component